MIREEEENEKKVWLILIILLVLIIGITFAWWTWNSTENTNVSLTVEGSSVTFDGGQDSSYLSCFYYNLIDTPIFVWYNICAMGSYMGSTEIYRCLNCKSYIYDTDTKKITGNSNRNAVAFA